jgi:hypothetical protein
MTALGHFKQNSNKMTLRHRLSELIKWIPGGKEFSPNRHSNSAEFSRAGGAGIFPVFPRGGAAPRNAATRDARGLMPCLHGSCDQPAEPVRKTAPPSRIRP